MPNMHSVYVWFLTLLLFSRCDPSSDSSLKENQISKTNCTDQQSSVELIISDMQGKHEARPRGVPDNQEWAFTPRISMGDDPGNWQAMIAWGQFYKPVDGNPATNVRVQIRNIKAY